MPPFLYFNHYNLSIEYMMDALLCWMLEKHVLNSAIMFRVALMAVGHSYEFPWYMMQPRANKPDRDIIDKNNGFYSNMMEWLTGIFLLYNQQHWSLQGQTNPGMVHYSWRIAQRAVFGTRPGYIFQSINVPQERILVRCMEWFLL